MNADIHTLYESDFYRVKDFRCRCTDCLRSKPEYSEAFCISFVRRGNFLFNVFRNALDAYTGCILVTKPGYEHTVTHTHVVPDQCTILEFSAAFSGELEEQYGRTTFFADRDLHSTLVKTAPETEFLHFYLVRSVLKGNANKLEMDGIVMDILRKVLMAVTDYRPDAGINALLKKNHLGTIESARDYITEHFTEDISLLQIARHCCVSPFHFSRLFKTFTAFTPHQFLLRIRLQQAEILVRNTAMPIADIAFSCGFNSVEYFTAAFRNRYKYPPAGYRSTLQNSRIS